MRLKLQNIDMFKDLDEATLKKIGKFTTEHSIAKDNIVFYEGDRKSTGLNPVHVATSFAVSSLKKKNKQHIIHTHLRPPINSQNHVPTTPYSHNTSQ